MKAIVVIGAGGHAKVCIEILHSMKEAVVCCIGSEGGEDFCMGIPVLQGDKNLVTLYSQGYRRAFIAIGSNQQRDRLAGLAADVGFSFVNAIHPSAIISPSAQISQGVAVMPGAVINAQAVIGPLVIVNTGATIDHDCEIGRAVHIAPQCGLAGNVSVGALSFLGIGSKVIPGMHIGSQVIVGAGAVVTTHIEDNQTVTGIPARKVK